MGFIYGSNGVTPNAGLLDQRLALDWIQENIHVFGGNASRVTIVANLLESNLFFKLQRIQTKVRHQYRRSFPNTNASLVSYIANDLYPLVLMRVTDTNQFDQLGRLAVIDKDVTITCHAHFLALALLSVKAYLLAVLPRVYREDIGCTFSNGHISINATIAGRFQRILTMIGSKVSKVEVEV